ncbi:MAG: GNAT family N-acetyltransferase [Thermoplasmataceae archaeon]
MIVLYESEEVDGFGKVNFLEDGAAWLGGLRVKPASRRLGVGSAITDYLIAMSITHGCKMVRMLIEDKNFRSLNLASKKGFRPLRSFRFYEGTPETSTWERTSFIASDLVCEGWAYVQLSERYHGTGTFLMSGGNLAYVWSGHTVLVQMIRSDKSLAMNGDGITCVPAEDAGRLSNRLVPMEGFSAATVFGKQL